MAEKPLRLKDYLELDAWGESLDGFRCYTRISANATTVRQLLDAELRDGRRFVRTRSSGALARLSSVLKLKDALPFSLPSPYPSVESLRGGSLSRSFSKRIRAAGFWRKRARADAYEGKAIERVIDSLDHHRGSFDFASPVVSSCSSWSQTGSMSGPDFLRSSRGCSSECLGEIAAVAAAVGGGGGCSPPSRRKNGRTDPKVVDRESMACHSEEEEEHLSPVSVMNFPSEDDEEYEYEEATTVASTSPKFRLTKVKRAHLHLAQQIRRFYSLAELEPVALEDRFAAFDGTHQQSTDHVASSDGEEEEKITGEVCGARDPPGVRTAEDLAAGPGGSFERLLLDFFVEGLSSCSGGTRLSREREEARLLEAARRWIDGDGRCWERRESRGAMEIGGMERSGRWRCSDEEVGQVGEELEGSVVSLLLEELVGDIVHL